MWLYSSPLEALVVVVITGTDRTVISYININSLMLRNDDESALLWLYWVRSLLLREGCGVS